MGQLRFRLSAAAFATIAALTGVASARADGGVPGLNFAVNFGAGVVPDGGGAGTRGGDADDRGDGGGHDGGGRDDRGDRSDDAKTPPAPGMTTVQTNTPNALNAFGAGSLAGPPASTALSQPGTAADNPFAAAMIAPEPVYFAPAGGDVAPAATSPAVPAASPRRSPPEVAALYNPFAPIVPPTPGRASASGDDAPTLGGSAVPGYVPAAIAAPITAPAVESTPASSVGESLPAGVNGSPAGAPAGAPGAPAGSHFAPNVATTASGSISDGPGGGSMLAYLTALSIAAGAGVLRPVTQASTRAPPSVAHSPPVPPG